jgi:hypothetical protein
MAEYCGVYHQNPYHLLGLHDIHERRGKRTVSQIVAHFEEVAKAVDDSTPEGKHLAKLCTGFARDYPKVAAFEGKKEFRTRESTSVPRWKLQRPGFGEHLEATLHQYFSEQALPFYSTVSDKVKGDPILYRVEFVGAWPSAREGEDLFSLPKDDPRFKERPAAEALEMYPDDEEFIIAYSLFFDKNGFQAWTDSFHNDDWKGWHWEHSARAHRLL